jgi:hypothetical protein
MSSMPMDKRAGLINRHGARARDRIRALSWVNRQRIEAELLLLGRALLPLSSLSRPELLWQ